jgi:hypothetical protein
MQETTSKATCRKQAGSQTNNSDTTLDNQGIAEVNNNEFQEEVLLIDTL